MRRWLRSRLRFWLKHWPKYWLRCGTSDWLRRQLRRLPVLQGRLWGLRKDVSSNAIKGLREAYAEKARRRALG